MKCGNVFNEKTVNIFTDASIHVYDREGYKETIGCIGAIVVLTDINGDSQIIDECMTIQRNTTNNESEIKAIDAGVLLASTYKKAYDNINLFSDSKICIKGLTEWIFDWVDNAKNNILYTKSNSEVKNQKIFISIINFINRASLNIKFYHQKGHVSNTQNSILNAKNVFSISNSIPLDNISDDFIKRISYYNNYVDYKTKEKLRDYINNNHICKPKEFLGKYLFDINSANINISKYRNHIIN